MFRAGSYRIVELNEQDSSYVFLLALALIGLAVFFLFRSGIAGWVLGIVQKTLQFAIRGGFQVWEHLLAWAHWPVFLGLVMACLIAGIALGGLVPVLRLAFAVSLLFMGTTACLAYMFIDLERYEVARGYKATHNPMKGQALALHLAEYGHQVRVPLLAAASLAMVGGFALLNQGLYETFASHWYTTSDARGGPAFADFLVYGLIHLLGVVDVLDLVNSSHVIRFAYVHQAAWPASTLLVLFKLFFTLVLLQQIFASLRQGKLLAETISDFWSPHEPIHERARNALPQYGAIAIGPLMVSLRGVSTLTREQRDRLPLILATIGPSTISVLLRHLHDPHEHVRAIAVAALGHLHARNAVQRVAGLAEDTSAIVRQSVVEALGVLGDASLPAPPQRRHRSGKRRPRLLLWLARREEPVASHDPATVAVETLQNALGDSLPAIRTQAAISLGKIGSKSARAVPGLIALLKDEDETVRCQAAAALGQVGLTEGGTVNALVELLNDASSVVKAAAARALGALKQDAAAAVPALVPLLQDRDEAVRSTAAEAIALVGPLDAHATSAIVEGLADPDTMVRAQTAEALGTIGAAAQHAAPALVEAIGNGNDRLRAKAVEALGKIGEGAAEVAVPTLVRALRDRDNWVSALAAEALGEMGESADEAVPALARSLSHLNAQVRANAAEALGKLGAVAVAARPGLEKATRDEDGGVRSQAIRALGAIGTPTASGSEAVLQALQDADPLVRTAAVETAGLWGMREDPWIAKLLPLLEDANDQVKVQVARVLPGLAGPTQDVLDGLSRRLLDDDSAWVQINAALALGRLGESAVGTGAALLRAAQTGKESVREQAMRAIAMVQPPEISAAFASGLKDSSRQIRKIASGGWIKAKSIPEEVIPALVEALQDPESQVRANAAQALSRLESLPAAAVPLLLSCVTDPSDALRMNAAAALRQATGSVVVEAMERLLEDANPRIRLVAASSLLLVDGTHAKATAAIVAALSDPAPRVRKAAVDLIETLENNVAVFSEAISKRYNVEDEPGLRAALTRFLDGHLSTSAAPAVADDE